MKAITTALSGIATSWVGGIACLLLGMAIGIVAAQHFATPAVEEMRFTEHRMPTLMMHPLGREGAYRHQIGNWKVLSSLDRDNDSLVLKYRDTYIAAVSAAPDQTLETVIINHPLHDSVMLILEDLNRKDRIGKMTTELLTPEGKKTGFIIDENMDGQPDLRFEYAGPHLYAWLDQRWHRVLRSSPPEDGANFEHTVIYRQQLHRIDLASYPYRLFGLGPEHDIQPGNTTP